MEFDLTYYDPGMVCDPDVAYEVNAELNKAWDIVENTGANLFLTGRAGTGKTTFLRKLRESSAKRLVVLAPTGVAAINAHGTTLHSFFQLPFAVYIPGKGFATNDKKYLNVSRQKKRLIMSLSLLVIDEISMVRPDILDAVDSILRRLRGSSAPFGGLQLLLIGDLRQLPPVVKESEWSLIKDHYPTPYFFESHALKRAGFATIELSTVYRQNDREFIGLLNAIRDGHATPETLRSINRRCIPGFNPPDREGYIRLTTHNRSAAALNNSRLAALGEPEFTFEAEVEGKFPEGSFPADRLLRLKKGAQVMFIKNDVGAERRFYNGLIGTITSISDEKICVLPSGGDEPIEVERAEWELSQYIVDETTKDITQQTIGVFKQYPLQLAWAVTIHKSQGLTFERAIIDAAHSFAPGQTYVALSRCRSLDGLVLEAPLPPGAVITDAGINEFIETSTSLTPDSLAVEEMKLKYTAALLCELFDFESLRHAYNDFRRAAMEYVVPGYPDMEADLDVMKGHIEDDLAGVARKFIASYGREAIGAALKDPESPLALRIEKGCDYFLGMVSNVEKIAAKLPRKVKNKTYAKRLDTTFQTLRDILAMKRILLGALSTRPFTVETYLAEKGRAVLLLDEQAVSPGRRR